MAAVAAGPVALQRRARGAVERIARKEARFRQSRPAPLRAQRSAAREAAPPLEAAEEGARAARRAAGAHPEGAEEVARAALPEDELRRAGLRRVAAAPAVPDPPRPQAVPPESVRPANGHRWPELRAQVLLRRAHEALRDWRP